MEANVSAIRGGGERDSQKTKSIELTCRAWTEVKENAIRKAWKIYAEPDD
jgi:hypothetical protein